VYRLLTKAEAAGRPRNTGGLSSILAGVMIGALLVGGRTEAVTVPEPGQVVRNVRDCGAVGDGIHDDTPAFLAALDGGRGVQGWHHLGTYRYYPQREEETQ